MARRRGRAQRSSATSGRHFAGLTAVVLVAAGVGVLSMYAYEHANPPRTAGAAAPVPTFTLGVRPATPGPDETLPATPEPTPPAATPAPAPTPTPAVEAPPREAERFLSAGTAALWRATAGRCGVTEPLVERSADGGATWTDVTARYLGLSQVAGLSADSPADVELIGGVGAGCEPQALRTYTRGEFWGSYPEVLAAARWIGLSDAGVVEGPAGPVAAPCADARSLRSAGDAVALVCEGTAFTLGADAAWAPFAVPDAVALDVDVDVDSGVVRYAVAHVDPSCAGLMVSRFDGVGGGAIGAACVGGLNPAAAAAIEVSGESVLVWSGDAFTTTALP